MMKRRKISDLKRMARATLSGRFGSVVGIMAAYILITFVMNGITTLIANGMVTESAVTDMGAYLKSLLPMLGVNIIVSILLQIFVCGLYKFLLKMARQEDYKFSDFFYGFTHSPDRIIVANLLQFALYFVIMIPVILALIVSMANPSFYFVALVMLCINIIFVIMVAYSFQLSPFLLMDNDYMGGLQSLAYSMQLMRGNKGRLFLIALSFIGWQILAVCTFGIGQIWVIPYSALTTIFFYMERTGELDGPVAQEESTTEEYVDAIEEQTTEAEETTETY